MFGFKKRAKKTVTAVIVAAGSGTRMGLTIKKQFIKLCGVPVIAHTISAFEKCDIIDDIIIVTADEDISEMFDIVKEYGFKKVSDIVAGGAYRTESVKNGLMHIRKSDYVAVHDGARPCITPHDIEKTVTAAITHGAAVLATRVTDTLKSVSNDGFITSTVDRSALWQVQTPQCFLTETLKKAYEGCDTDKLTDDCMAVELSGGKIAVVEGNSLNIKITTEGDIDIAQAILNKNLGIESC